jgi:acyl transferase domain-containing protein
MVFAADYEQISLRDPDFMPQYAATGGANAILANRLSWFYNFSGASQAIDTACSGSLVAVHQAVRCLQAHDSDMVS